MAIVGTLHFNRDDPQEQQRGDGRMSEEVRAVTDVARDIAAVKEFARSVAADLKKNIDEVTDHLSTAQEISAALKSAGNELKDILGQTSNNPPKSGGSSSNSGGQGGV